jgi:hypothetical protein
MASGVHWERCTGVRSSANSKPISELPEIILG